MRLYITKNVFLKLNDEQLLQIFEHLTLIDIAKVMLVSKQWQNICTHTNLWKTLFLRSFGLENVPVLVEVKIEQEDKSEKVEQKSQTWLEAFKERFGQYARPANKKRILNGEKVPTVAAETEIYSTIMAIGFDREAALSYDSLQQVEEESMDIPKEEELSEKFVKDFLAPGGFETGLGDSFGIADVDMVDQADLQDTIAMLTSMGYTEKQAKVALKKNGYSLELAAEWLVTHPDYNFDL